MRSLPVLLLLAVSFAPLRAQDAGTCPHGRISHIFIDNHSIFDTTDPDLDPRFAWAYGVANSLHIQTRERVIARELLLEVGDCFDPDLAEESERLLRGFGALARVDIFPVAQPDGTVHMVVDTQDEWSTRVDIRARVADGSMRLSGLRVEESNLLGTGQTIGFFYRDEEFVTERGINYGTQQLAGTRWDLSADLGRTRAGTRVGYVVAYPFVGEVGRWGAAQGFRREDRYFRFIADDSTGVLTAIRDQVLDLAVLTRLGPQGNLTLIGAALSFHELDYPGGERGLLVSRAGLRQDTTASEDWLLGEVRPQLRRVNSIRGSLLLGQRNIWWARRRGFDSMRGVQDIRLGAEAQLAVGRSITALEEDDDVATTFTLYTGIEHGHGLSVFRGRMDARRSFDAPAASSEWEDVVAEAEVLTYLRSSDTSRHTLVLRAAGAGGWHTRTPFQLTLGGESAVRGHDRERFPGGRRLVLSAEDRLYLGWPYPDVLDLGLTAFVDAGRMWAGDVPFGSDSGWRGSAGLGLRGAFPAGGRSTYRLDVAFPLDGGGGYQIIFSVRELLGVTTHFGDPQVERSRLNGISGDVFSFPR
ncbi:MAG TPA: hypothetical protein VMK65_13930 [Longimicrobiales bacterium]|nr:hypothetical protein [Longimicrobiales bacterium]